MICKALSIPRFPLPIPAAGSTDRPGLHAVLHDIRVVALYSATLLPLACHSLAVRRFMSSDEACVGAGGSARVEDVLQDATLKRFQGNSVGYLSLCCWYLNLASKLMDARWR